MADRKAENIAISGQPQKTIMEFETPKKPKTNKYALGCAMLASMTSVLLGYDIGVMSGAIIYIKEDLKISDGQVEVLAGILNLFSLIGSCAAGRTSDWIGRRYTIVVSSWLVGSSPESALAMQLMIAPVYTGRGVHQCWDIVGVDSVTQRKFLTKPQTPKKEALIRLAEIKEAAGIPMECTQMTSFRSPKRSHGEDVWKELLVHPTPAVRHVLIAAIGIHFFQQCSGIDSVVLYSPRIFEKAGITSSDHKLLATVAVGATKTVFILVATFLLDKVGRRPLLLSSVAGMILSQAALGFGLTVIENTHHKVMWAVALCITTVMSYVAFFSIGMGPITWVYSSEIFPLKLRAQGASLAVAMNRVTSAVISMTFISLYKAITIGGAFFLYAGIATVSWVFFYFMLPETQGRTLEDMAGLFGNFKWKFAKKNNIRNKEVNDDSNGQVQLGTKG
uniref:Major facilitator superfamily (MFS) profile domain-containing protein n=1 Tax=Fagus sylvatica TaxID=28930 RepID=A0A2N9FNF4_FAGSY